MRASLGSTVSLIFQRGFALKSYTTDDGDPESAVDALKDLLPDLVDALAEHA